MFLQFVGPRAPEWFIWDGCMKSKRNKATTYRLQSCLVSLQNGSFFPLYAADAHIRICMPIPNTNRQRRNAAKHGCQSLCQPQRNHIIKKSWLKQWRTFSMMEKVLPECWWNVWMWDILQKKEPPHSLTLHYKWPPWRPAEGKYKYKYGAVFSSALQTIKTGRKIGKIIFKIKSKSLRITTTRIAYRRTLTKVLKTENRIDQWLFVEMIAHLKSCNFARRGEFSK